MRADLFGYFNAPGQTVPAHDPGLEAPCLFCLEPLNDGREVYNTSLMPVGNDRCYFYRGHKACFEKLGPGEQDLVEGTFIDSLIGPPQ